MSVNDPLVWPITGVGELPCIVQLDKVYARLLELDN